MQLKKKYATMANSPNLKNPISYYGFYG